MLQLSHRSLLCEGREKILYLHTLLQYSLYDDNYLLRPTLVVEAYLDAAEHMNDEIRDDRSLIRYHLNCHRVSMKLLGNSWKHENSVKK